MANFVVWIDNEHSKIFELHPGEVVETKMKRHEIKHHSSSEKSAEKKNRDPFFRDVAAHLKAAHEILIVGPGLAKEHFKSFLEKHGGDSLSKKVVGMLTTDHPTDGQVVALAQKFFKAHLQFE